MSGSYSSNYVLSLRALGKGHAWTDAECGLIQGLTCWSQLIIALDVLLCPLDASSFFLFSVFRRLTVWTHPQAPWLSLLVRSSQWEAWAQVEGGRRDGGMFISQASSLSSYGVTTKPVYPEIIPKPLACLECHNGASVKERDCQCRLDVGDAGLIPGLGRFPLEEDTATHSSILAWRIPWTEEPGWLQSIGSQRIGHD